MDIRLRNIILCILCCVSSALWAVKAVRIIFADLGKYIPVDHFALFLTLCVLRHAVICVE